MDVLPGRAAVVVERLLNQRPVEDQPLLSVVVPVLNEAAGLNNFLQNTLKRLPGYAELILVDGGSTDGSQEIALNFPLPLLKADSPGRAAQMNIGAKTATGAYLMFLHADTELPESFADDFALWSAATPVWGYAPVRLDGNQFWCRIIETGINLRTRLTSGASGDQALMVRNETFKNLGGFAEIELMEDLDLSYRLRRKCRPRRLHNPVTTSSRRWRENGVLRTVLLMWCLRLSYRLGVPPRQLAHWYSSRKTSAS